jgi:hypothetical protein
MAYSVFGRGKRDAAPAVMAWLERVARASAVNRVYEVGYRRVTLVLADGLAWIDRYVVDGAINMLGYSTLEGGARARRIQTGQVPDYLAAVVLGAACIAAWVVTR